MTPAWLEDLRAARVPVTRPHTPVRVPADRVRVAAGGAGGEWAAAVYVGEYPKNGPSGALARVAVEHGPNFLVAVRDLVLDLEDELAVHLARVELARRCGHPAAAIAQGVVWGEIVLDGAPQGWGLATGLDWPFGGPDHLSRWMSADVVGGSALVALARALRSLPPLVEGPC